MSLPAFILGQTYSEVSVQISPPQNALNPTAKYEPIAGALLVSTCAVIALWITLMI